MRVCACLVSPCRLQRRGVDIQYRSGAWEGKEGQEGKEGGTEGGKESGKEEEEEGDDYDDDFGASYTSVVEASQAGTVISQVRKASVKQSSVTGGPPPRNPPQAAARKVSHASQPSRRISEYSQGSVGAASDKGTDFPPSRRISEYSQASGKSRAALVDKLTDGSPSRRISEYSQASASSKTSLHSARTRGSAKSKATLEPGKVRPSLQLCEPRVQNRVLVLASELMCLAYAPGAVELWKVAVFPLVPRSRPPSPQ